MAIALSICLTSTSTSTSTPSRRLTLTCFRFLYGSGHVVFVGTGAGFQHLTAAVKKTWKSFAETSKRLCRDSWPKSPQESSKSKVGDVFVLFVPLLIYIYIYLYSFFQFLPYSRWGVAARWSQLKARRNLIVRNWSWNMSVTARKAPKNQHTRHYTSERSQFIHLAGYLSITAWGYLT